MKQAIWNFERLATSFTDYHWKSTEAIHTIFQVILALTYEVKSGRITTDTELSEIQSSTVMRAMRSMQGGAPTTVDEVLSRYAEVKFEQDLVSPLAIENLLLRGWVDKAEVRRELDSSSYFSPPSEQPAWKTVLGIWRLSDEAIEEAADALEKQFDERIFVEPGEMFQVFGTRLFLSVVGLLDKDKKTVERECVEYVDDLHRQGKLRNKLFEEAMLGDFQSWDGYSIVSQDAEEFQIILSYYKGILDKIVEEAIPTMIEDLLNLIESNPNSFGRKIALNTQEESSFSDFPILKYVSTQVLVGRIISSKPEAQSRILAALKLRYQRLSVQPLLQQELPWLKEFYDCLQNAAASMRPASRFRLRAGLKNNVQPFLPTPESTDAER